MLDILTAITDVANNRKLTFEAKLNAVLQQIVECMHVKKASIMLLKNPRTLEVVASTNPAIIGVRQRLDEPSPSSWVVKSMAPLYADGASQCTVPTGRFKHYQADAFYLVPLMSNGKAIGVISVTEKIGGDRFDQDERDILLRIMGHVIIALENHRMAASLLRQHRLLKQKNQELRKLEALKADLFNMLIHDLKGPISDVVANLDILSYTLTDENLEYVEVAMSGCNTLYDMISNLLDIARLENGKLPLLYEDIDPQELIKEALARLLLSLRSKQLTLVEALPPLQGIALAGDRTLLLRVLQNLLNNAVRFSPIGADIAIGYKMAGSTMVEFFVQDQGPGIPDQFREAVFEKYAQLSKNTDASGRATGLGLAFCKLAVQAHGGAIGVECDDRPGSRFFFKLPCTTH